jgi:hypothetical protein
VQAAVLVVAEIGLFAAYGAHDARLHWATEFLVALIAAAVWLTGFLLVAARGQLLVVLWVHLLAMAPDPLFYLGVPHHRWMDVFFAHVASHYLPGGDTAWLVLALLAVAGYTAVLTAWLRARRIEAGRGAAPGIGIGGSAVPRPRRDPAEHDLAYWRAGPQERLRCCSCTGSAAPRPAGRRSRTGSARTGSAACA